MYIVFLCSCVSFPALCHAHSMLMASFGWYEGSSKHFHATNTTVGKLSLRAGRVQQRQVMSAWVVPQGLRSSGKRGTISWVRPYPTQHCSLENSAALFCLLLFCLTDLDMGQIVVHCPFQMSKEGPNSRWWNKRAVSVRKNKKSYIDSKLILYPFMW